MNPWPRPVTQGHLAQCDGNGGRRYVPHNNDFTMVIQLWYNTEVSQWRWTLTDPLEPTYLVSGNSSELRVAMEDVGRTVRWRMDTGFQDEWSPD